MYLDNLWGESLSEYNQIQEQQEIKLVNEEVTMFDQKPC